jgi:hypothetical protein
MKSCPPNGNDVLDRAATEQLDALDAPDVETTAEMLTKAEELGERVAEYRYRATAIDDEFERKNEDRNYGLDDLPFGEELIRTRDLPSEIATAQKLLERIQSGELGDAAAAGDFQHAALIVEDVETTLSDCKSLPPPEPDFDEYDAEDDSDDDQPSDDFCV